MNLREGGDGNPGISLSLFGPAQKLDTELYDGIALNFSLPFKLGSRSLKDYAQEKINKDKEMPDLIIIEKDLEEITVGDLKGYTYTVSGLGTFQYLFLQSQFKTDNFVEISNLTSDPTNQGFAQIVEQVLASFKFLE